MHRRRALRTAAVAFLFLTACGSEAGPPTSATSSSSIAGGIDHIVGESSDVFVPVGVGRAPLVVLVPGGAWRTADPAGLADLAAALADAGIAAMTTSVRAGEDGVVYPVPVEDVICAASSAAAAVAASGVEVGPVVLFGHSSGGHLAALAALAGERYRPSCDDDVVAADALIGVAGTYDVDTVHDLAFDLFGVTKAEAPEVWEEGNAVLAAGLRPELPVLLIHGGADQLVPMSFTDDFAQALRVAGHDVTVTVVEGADHHTIYRPEMIGDVIIEWVSTL